MVDEYEGRRLKAMQDLAVLDTPPEPIFDALAAAASAAFGSPIALISLVDDRRQWFKACIGLSVRQTARDVAFCDYAIRTDEPLIVPDARLDPRFAANPLVTGAPHIRFYAGAPLILPGGERLGTLCVMGQAPREVFSDQQRLLLKSLARAVVEALLARGRADDASYMHRPTEPCVKDFAVAGMIEGVTESRAEIELFENAFRHAPIGMALVAPDGRFLKVNGALCRIVGRRERELLKVDFQAITHPDDLDLDLKYMERLLAGQIPSYDIVKRYVRRDGTDVLVRLSVSTVRNEDGTPKHFISQIVDLSAQRAAEEALRKSEARYRLMAENITDVMAETNADGRLIFVSPASVAQTGWSPEELLGRKATELAHPDDVEPLRKAFATVMSGGECGPLRWRSRRKDRDGWLWLESKPVLVTNSSTGEPVFLDIVRDVTDDVAQSLALADAREAAEAAAAAKGEFLANMSHEIRTPLTAVIGFGSILEARTDLAPESRRYVERICSAGRGLLTIVNDVLDFSKLEAGQVEIKPQAVSPLQAAQDVVAMFQHQAEAKGLELEIDSTLDQELTVLLDPERFRQILLNLVGNAVKFTASGGVTVSVGHLDGWLAVAVTDTGAGIDEAAQKKLFQRFSQVDASSTRRHGGTGLGLAICKGLVEAMGGEIGVTSTLGEGATFRLAVPAPLDVPIQALDVVDEGDGLAGLRALIVDDHAQNREVGRAILERLGMEVTDVGGGVEALEALEVAPMDFVLMDLRMPGLDGRETLARLRAREGPNQWVPVIAFSASANLSGISAQGFDGFAHKPIDPAQLTRAISEALVAQLVRMAEAVYA